MNKQPHEISDACAKVHCYSCDVDEDGKHCFIACMECGHVYRTRWHLLWAYWRRQRSMGTRLWPWLVLTRKPAQIWWCQECSHSF